MSPIFTGFEPVSSVRIYVNHSFNGIEPSTTLAEPSSMVFGEPTEKLHN